MGPLLNYVLVRTNNTTSRQEMMRAHPKTPLPRGMVCVPARAFLKRAGGAPKRPKRTRSMMMREGHAKSDAKKRREMSRSSGGRRNECATCIPELDRDEFEEDNLLSKL